jgi:hypothetical protein
VKIFPFLVLIGFLFASGNAASSKIEQLKLFGVEAIDSLPKQYEDMVIGKIDSIRKEECVVPFFDGIDIKQKLAFAALPCLQMFAIEDGREDNLINNSHKQFLFNKCDSSVYPFGGGAVRYSKFMKAYLPSIIQKGDSAVKALASLYIYSSSIADNYQIISNSYNFLQIWRDESKIRPALRRSASENEIKNESMLVMHRISEFEAIPKKDYYEVYAATWDQIDGAVEEWRFRVSNNIFELLYHRVIMYNVGPYFQLN